MRISRRARKVARILSRGRQYRFRRAESQILAIGADLRRTFRPDGTNLACVIEGLGVPTAASRSHSRLLSSASIATWELWRGCPSTTTWPQSAAVNRGGDHTSPPVGDYCGWRAGVSAESSLRAARSNYKIVSARISQDRWVMAVVSWFTATSRLRNSASVATGAHFFSVPQNLRASERHAAMPVGTRFPGSRNRSSTTSSSPPRRWRRWWCRQPFCSASLPMKPMSGTLLRFSFLAGVFRALRSEWARSQG